MTRVFVVDDHPIMRRGYAALINREEDMTVCGEAENAPDALSKIAELQPDIVVADIGLEGMSGLEMLKRLRVENPHILALVVSMYDELLYAERAIAAGAQGYIMKSAVDTTVIAAIRKIMKGGIYLSDQISQRILARFSGSASRSIASPVERLSDREIEVFDLIGRGMSTAKIAEAMMLSPKTIETYRSRIKEKLGLGSASELVQQAVLRVQEKS
jgi:DNA-binding NarL/FixJ family response regulator